MEITFPDQPEKASADLEAACRPWLRLDATAADIAACGGVLESQSCFDHGGVAVRVLIKAGPEASGLRAWIETGTSIGPPAREPILEKIETAERLLAHAYDGLTQGCPVVVAVRPEEFAAGSPFGPLLEFTRTHLPLGLRVRCAVRVFAGDPQPFLELGANLLAIPRDSITRLMNLRRDSILLDGQAQRIDLREAPASACAYARVTVNSFLQSSELANALQCRVDALIRRPELPDRPQLDWMEAAARWIGNQDEITFDLDWRHLDADWAQALRPEEWSRLSLSVLKELALGDGTPQLRALASEEVDRRAARLDIEPPEWDVYVRQDPPAAVNLMLGSRQWSDWRASTQCAPEELRLASIGWMGSPHWLRHEPLLEDWVVVIRDLAGELTDADIERIARLSPRSGVFPPIQWFERMQHDDLRRLRQRRPLPELDLPADPPALDSVQQGQGADRQSAATEVSPHAPAVSRSPSSRWRLRLWIFLIALLGFAAGVWTTLLWKNK